MNHPVRHMFELFIPHAKETQVRRWAAENAYSLVFILAMFILTWVFLIIDIFVGLTR